MSDKRKKFKDTKVGQFLLGKSGLVQAIGDVMPDKGLLGIVKNLINNDPELPPEDKEKAMKLLELDMVEMEEVSKRWVSDMKSDSWLSKNTRPMSLIFLTVSMVLLILLTSGSVRLFDSWLSYFQCVPSQTLFSEFNSSHPCFFVIYQLLDRSIQFVF